MERLGLLYRRKDLVETLSGGLKRRVEIAKALLHRPRGLLMEKPRPASTRRRAWMFRATSNCCASRTG